MRRWGIRSMRYHVVENHCEDGGYGDIPMSWNCYKQRVWCIIYDVYWIITAWKPKREVITTLRSWPSVFHKVYRWELGSFLVSQTLGPRPKYARYSDLLFLFLVTKSLPDLFLILGIIRYPIFVDPFPVVFTVSSLVISDVFFVLLTIGSLAADEPFPNVFMPTFTTWFENLGVLGTITFLPGQDLLSVLCIIVFIVGFPTNNYLVIPRALIGPIHLAWCLANYD